LGGSLNLMRKRPGSAPSENVSVAADSWGRVEGTYDFTAPNIAGENIAFRGVLSLLTTKAFYHKYNRRSIVATANGW
jgi:outer membrane receptor for ferric coprogen and ferric-rhodotorulic acid